MISHSQPPFWHMPRLSQRGNCFTVETSIHEAAPVVLGWSWMCYLARAIRAKKGTGAQLALNANIWSIYEVSRMFHYHLVYILVDFVICILSTFFPSQCCSKSVQPRLHAARANTFRSRLGPGGHIVHLTLRSFYWLVLARSHVLLMRSS